MEFRFCQTSSDSLPGLMGQAAKEAPGTSKSAGVALTPASCCKAGCCGGDYSSTDGHAGGEGACGTDSRGDYGATTAAAV